MASTSVKLGPEWERFQRYLRKLRGPGMNKILNLASYRIATHIMQMVQHAYDTARFERHELTTAAYLEPASDKRQWAGATPLKRSGGLRDGVEAYRVANGQWAVRIDPDMTYAGDKGDPHDAARGLPLAQVADWLEHGRSYLVRWTPKMRAYLGMLARKGGSKQNAGVKGQPITGDSFFVHLQAKPVWAETLKKAHRAVISEARHINLWMHIDKIDKVPTISVRRTKFRGGRTT